MSEESEAVREIAATSGKAIDAGREVSEFIARIVGGPLKQAAGIWEDRLKYTRAVNQLKLIEKFEDHLRQRGLTAPTRSVPLSFAVPLLQAATLEEDGDLQDMWAAMLANAADECVEIQLRRAFISILEDMTTLDAQILKAVGDAENMEDRVCPLWSGFHVGYLPEKAVPASDYHADPSPSRDVSLAIANLMRLNLLRHPDNADGYANHNEVTATELGREFLRICSVDAKEDT